MRKPNFYRMLKFLPLVVLFAALFGFIVMWLWNWLTPALFGWRPIGYWQAWGIIVLCKILFGGFRGGSGDGHWRHRMLERCEQMSPEEREKFRQAFLSRWGQPVPPPPPPPTA